MSPRLRGFLVRGGRVLLKTLLVLALLAVLLPVALVFALRFDAVSTRVASTVNSALATSFRGRIHIDAIDWVDFRRVAARARIEDARGNVVVNAVGLDARVFWPALIVNVLSGDEPLRIELDEVHVLHAEVRLIDEGDGTPTIATAFEPRTPSPPSPPSGAPPPVVSIGRIYVKHAWVHGGLAAFSPIDADVQQLTLSLRLDRGRLVLPVERAELRVRALPQGLDPRGSLRGRLEVPLEKGEIAVQATYRGLLAGSEATASVALANGRLTGKLEAPAVSRATVTRLVPELDLVGTARVTANVAGTLPELGFDAEIVAEAGRVTARGSVRAEETTHIVADLEAERFDLSRVLPDAPASQLHVAAHADVLLAAEITEGSYTVKSGAGHVAGQALPPFSLNGKLRADSKQVALSGELDVDEPGAATRAAYELTFAGERGTIELRSSSVLVEPARLARLTGVRTAGRLSTAIVLRLPEKHIDGSAQATLSHVAVAGNALGSTSLSARVSGALEAPRFALALDARDVRAQGRSFERAKVRAEGTPALAELDGRLYGSKPDELWFKTTLRSGALTELLDTELGLLDREGPVKVSAKRVAFGAGSLALEDLLLTGPGSAAGSFEQRGNALDVRARLTDLDLGRLMRLVGLELPVHEARATLDVRYTATANDTSGFVVGRVEDVAYDKVRRAHADVDLRLVGERLTGTVRSALAPGAKVLVAVDDLIVPGPPFELPAPERMLGRIAVRGTADLRSMTPLLAIFPEIPIGDARGSVTADIVYERQSDSLPTLEAHVVTKGLELAGRLTRKEPIVSTDEARAASTWNLRDVDVKVDLLLDAAERQLLLEGRAQDEHGELLRLDVSASELPRAPTLGALARAWQDVPVRASLSVPERRLRRLPAPLRPDAMNGTVTLVADLEGSVRDPRLRVAGNFERLRAPGGRVAGERPEEVDLEFQADYAREGGKLSVHARRRRSIVADISGTWEGDLLEFDLKKPETLALRARAKLDKVQLETISALKNRAISGWLSGDVNLAYGKGERELVAELSLNRLELGRLIVDSVRAGVVMREGELRGDVSVRGRAGTLDAAMRSGLAWQGRVTPETRGDIDATLDARDFRLASLWPFTSQLLSELDGRLSAKLGARVRDGRLALTGSGRLDEGVVQIPALGQRFDRISGRIDVMPEEIRVRDVRAHGLSGQLTAESVISLDEQLALRRVKAKVNILERDRIPITFEGVAMGDAWGDVDLTFLRKTDADQVEVKLSNMHVLVPDAAQHSVQSLAPAEGIRIGVRQPDQKFAALPVQPLERGSGGEEVRPMIVTIDLGKSLSIQRGDMVDVQLSGKLEARIAEETSVVGRIQVIGGTLDVSGKRFEIESGTVAFTGGDPANPTVTAVARWDSPAGYTVYAEYAGTAENGHLKLRAEPALTEDQIVTLLMFGTPDGSFAGNSSGGSSDTAASAVGIAGGTAAKGLNRALSNITNLDVQARIDTSTGSSRPEIVVGLSPRLSARVTRAIGEPTPGTSPDRTFLTLELRLKRNWALSGLIGDRGASALDLIWRHRY